MRLVKVGAVFVAVLLCGACSSGMHAGLMTLLQEVVPSKPDVRHATLQNEFRYLWVQAHNQEALLVWVGNERSPQGQISVWVSADGVVVRLLNGRLVSVSEPRRSWQLTHETPISPGPDKTSYPANVIQTSDQQPGFHMGIERIVQQIEMPATPAKLSWYAGAPNVRWIQEVDPKTGKQIGIFALNSEHQTLAGERCITSDWCVRWQAWPANPQAAAS